MCAYICFDTCQYVGLLHSSFRIKSWFNRIVNAATGAWGPECVRAILRSERAEDFTAKRHSLLSTFFATYDLVHRVPQSSITMPRVTPCRTLKVLALPWIVMVGMWFFLPSPSVSLRQRDAYIQNRIASSKTVITAVNYEPFKRAPGRTYSGECSECSDLLIHWRLIKSGHSLLLASSYYEHSPINITKILGEAAKWNAAAWEAEEKWIPYFSRPLVLEHIPGGSTDEEINLPWFQMTDQKLMHYNMHNFEASLKARAIVPEPGVLEIWRSAYVEPFLYSMDPEQAAYDKLKFNKSETDYLASFQFVSDQKPTRVIVNHLAGELPSRTYTIRKALLFPLAPVYSILLMPVLMIFDPLSPFFYIFVVCFSLLVGFVCYRRIREGGLWRRRRQNRGGRRDVWGPTGPVNRQTHRSWFDEEKTVSLQRPDTVRLGRNWKASGSRASKWHSTL
jgi:hypothetical protein